MNGTGRDLLRVSLALLVCLVVVATTGAAGASARGDAPVVEGQIPKPPSLGIASAKSAAWAKVRAFQLHTPAYTKVAFAGCVRNQRKKVTCEFEARAASASNDSACRLTVVVEGQGREVEAELHASCRANPERFLTFHRASTAVHAVAERLAGTRVAVLTSERKSNFRIAMEVEWETPKAECGARFIARLVRPHDLRVTHTPASCRRPFKPPAESE
jgi:hypothetical protein